MNLTSIQFPSLTTDCCRFLMMDPAGLGAMNYDQPAADGSSCRLMAESLRDRYSQARLSLVQLLHYCALIGRELHLDVTPALLCHEGALGALSWFFMA